MPKWFARLFAIVMILACGTTAYFAYQHEKLSYAVEDARTSLETSRAREYKQESEYDQVQKELPEAQELLAQLKPESEEAQKNLNEKREERSTLREKVAQLQESVAGAEATASELHTTYQTQILDVAKKAADLEDHLTRAINLLLSSGN